MKVKDAATLRRRRVNEGLTQRDLAFLVRRSQATVWKLENGQLKTITEDLALAIAARLKRDWEELFTLEEHEIMPKLTSSLSIVDQPEVMAS